MPISVQLPEDVEKRLDHLAVLTGRSKADCLTQFLIDHIEDLEDLEDLYEIEEEIQGVRAGLIQTIPLEEMMKEYGMEN